MEFQELLPSFQTISEFANLLNFYKLELLLGLILLLLFTLILSFLNQRNRYGRLKKWIKQNRKELKRQEDLMYEIEKKIDAYKKSQESLGYWGRIKDELTELSKLPTLKEEEKEFVLKTQISKLKKDITDVTATEKEININIYEGNTPLKCSYSLPKKINPSKLTITYKGNTLEIRAPKV
jgi:HSP20 family molecular chaperone IbpA